MHETNTPRYVLGTAGCRGLALSVSGTPNNNSNLRWVVLPGRGRSHDLSNAVTTVDVCNLQTAPPGHRNHRCAHHRVEMDSQHHDATQTCIAGPVMLTR